MRKLLGAVVALAAAAAVFVAVVQAGSSQSAKPTAPSITREPFGSVNGTPVDRYTLTNSSGMTVKILTYGGIVQQVWVADRRHDTDNVTLGFATLNDYVTTG